MKHISYSFSNSDIEAITFALTILPSLGIEETEAQAAINYQCCCSAGEKLIKHDTNIVPNEFRVILASLQAVQLINQGELEVDQETKQKCSSYLFTVNKLVSVFDKQMSKLTFTAISFSKLLFTSCRSLSAASFLSGGIFPRSFPACFTV